MKHPAIVSCSRPASAIRRFIPVVLLALLVGGVIVACKQGEGGRCQVDADCEDGLRCNQGIDPPRCQGTNGGNDPIDAQLPDADPDAPSDTSDATDATDAT